MQFAIVNYEQQNDGVRSNNGFATSTFYRGSILYPAQERRGFMSRRRRESQPSISLQFHELVDSLRAEFETITSMQVV